MTLISPVSDQEATRDIDPFRGLMFCLLRNDIVKAKEIFAQLATTLDSEIAFRKLQRWSESKKLTDRFLEMLLAADQITFSKLTFLVSMLKLALVAGQSDAVLTRIARLEASESLPTLRW